MKRCINEFKENQIVQSSSGRYKIIRFNNEVVKGNKYQIKSATCISEFSGKETIISVNPTSKFELSKD